MFSISIPLAILITALAIIYQRTTGPTYPQKFTLTSASAEKIRVKLLRSQENDNDANIEIPNFGKNLSGEIFYRRYPTNDAWTNLRLENNPESPALLITKLPRQPAAGKLEYYIKLQEDEKTYDLGSADKPIIIRFKGPVPTWILAPHIFCMFFAMLLSSIAAIEALYKTEKFYFLSLLTTGFLIFGGMFLGPLVQKYAFGVYWAGFPYGLDLTDNKLLIGVLAWSTASLLSWKKRRYYASVVAAIILLLVYSIPHSRMGSEFNYHEGEVQTQKKF